MQNQNTTGQGRLIITPPGHHYEEFMRPASTSNYFNKSSSSQKYSFSNNTINRLLNPTSGDKHHFNAAQQTPYRNPGHTTDFNKQAGGLVTPEPHINKILGKKPPVLVQQRVTPHQQLQIQPQGSLIRLSPQQQQSSMRVFNPGQQQLASGIRFPQPITQQQSQGMQPRFSTSGQGPQPVLHTPEQSNQENRLGKGVCKFSMQMSGSGRTMKA